MHAGHALDFIRYAATVQGNYKPQVTLLGVWLIASRAVLLGFVAAKNVRPPHGWY